MKTILAALILVGVAISISCLPYRVSLHALNGTELSSQLVFCALWQDPARFVHPPPQYFRTHLRTDLLLSAWFLYLVALGSIRVLVANVANSDPKNPIQPTTTAPQHKP